RAARQHTLYSLSCGPHLVLKLRMCGPCGEVPRSPVSTGSPSRTLAEDSFRSAESWLSVFPNSPYLGISATPTTNRGSSIMLPEAFSFSGTASPQTEHDTNSA